MIQLSLRIGHWDLGGDEGVVIIILVVEDVIGDLGVSFLEVSQLRESSLNGHLINEELKPLMPVPRVDVW